MAPLDDAALAAAIHDHAEGATVALRVVPRAPRTVFAGRYGASLKLKVHAPPVDGAANDEVRRHLADRCGVRPSEVSLVVGERSRDKVALVRGRNAESIRRALAGG